MAAEPKLLPDLLLRAAEAASGRDAVRCQDRSLTFGDTATASLALAATLGEAGIRPGDRVGICMPKRVEVLPAVYGSMLAGAAYVPLDPRSPASRNSQIAGDCEIAALVATPALAGPLLAALADRGPDVVITVGDGDADAPVAQIPFAQAIANGGSPAVAIDEDDLAYILYTSGSTGTPKGVMLSHGNAMAFVAWSAGAIGSSPNDVFSNHAPMHFDLSVFDLYVSAWGGAPVSLVPEESAYLAGSLASFIRDDAITVWYSVPSALIRLVGALSGPSELPSLRTVVFAGEPYATPRLRELRRMLPEVALWNLYGPTETNVITGHRVETLPEDDTPIPIGVAASGARLIVLREDGGLAEAGEEGDLLACGPTVMRGYWGRPELTEKSVVSDPTGSGSVAYRTGDLVRVRPDGALDFIGRRDHQIKSRGYRVELGDVEAAVASAPSVHEAVVVGAPHDEWGTEIVAYVVPTPGGSLSQLDLKRHVASRLPRYMVPSTVYVVDEIPHTGTGKADRRSLVERHLAGA